MEDAESQQQLTAAAKGDEFSWPLRLGRSAMS